MSNLRTKIILATIAPALITGGVAIAATQGGSSSPASPNTPAKTAKQLHKRHRNAGVLYALSHPGGPRFLSGDVKLFIKGQVRDFTLTRGVVQSTTPSSITLKEADGTTVTVPVDATAKVRNQGKKATLGDVKAGEVALTVSPQNAPAKWIRAHQPKQLKTTP